MPKESTTLFNQDPLKSPLAERCRPLVLDDLIGHDDALGNKSPIYRQIKSGFLPSLIIWGPPGVGKTTFARVVADALAYHFRDISAVSAGVKDVKEIIREARGRLQHYNKQTILFIDEVHRFNKAQQDALLHAVEKGELILIGATTENPSFEVNPALLSRCSVIKLETLNRDDLLKIINRALKNDPVLSQYHIELQDTDQLLFYGSGDARRVLNLLETGFFLSDRTADPIVITEDVIRNAASQSPLFYDKKGEYHYDTISAFIKSVRGSDPDAAVYWLVRMLEAGEDPLFIARRLIILASEDIGNAEPYALSLANNGFEAVRNIGMPEARIVLAQVTTYLASVPKSNASYKAIEAAMQELKTSGLQQVPLHLRNAPTRLMKELKYGGDYIYPHDRPGHFARQQYLPDSIRDKQFYYPSDMGRESKLKLYLDTIWQRKKESGNK